MQPLKSELPRSDFCGKFLLFGQPAQITLLIQMNRLQRTKFIFERKFYALHTQLAYIPELFNVLDA